MEIGLVLVPRGLRRVGSVQADDVVVLVLNPDPADEQAITSVFLWRDIEHHAAHVADELTVNIAEVVVITIEALAVNKHHPGKADGLVLNAE